MNTPPKPDFTIKASYLGPIFSVDGKLSKNAQNLVFARNGTGKSFLSRAFRYLDLYRQGKDVSGAALNLVSDESADGKGSFSFSCGNELGTLQLDQLEKPGDKVSAEVFETIFHVFSEDFVHEELRARQYEIDGEIENQIVVDRANIELQDTQEELKKAEEAKQAEDAALQAKFDNEKEGRLVKKAEIKKQLSEYRRLNLESLLDRFSDKPDTPEQSFESILSDLDSLKSIPPEPVYPERVGPVGSEDIDLKVLEGSLQKVTSPSSVSDEIKRKIDAHPSFYQTGTRIVEEEHRATCPFCEQGIANPDPKAVIDAYVSYFAGEEVKHKEELEDYSNKLGQKEENLKEIETQLTRQKSCFNDLKHHVPSRKGIEIADGKTALTDARTAISEIKAVLVQKTEALASTHSLPADDLAAHIAGLDGIIEDNNSKVAELTRVVGKSDEARRDLQRKACTVFGQEFAFDNWSGIEALRNLDKVIQTRKKELGELEKASSTKARDRVAETFEMLLKEFFADKYVFDRESFILKRGDKEMKRGPHRTLSDGEKTVMAFCYFVACVHRKVTSDSDYGKMFLVFDDPVTSMSYDFVFSIAQTLKSLRISDQGEVSINPAKIYGNKNRRPRLLVLTHNSYFFNICSNNRVIEKESTFSLYRDGSKHRLACLNSYVAPFEQQLEHVYRVANGDGEPDHSTGNAIRQVLEAIGRFCRPDKSHSLQSFVTFLAGDEDFQIKSGGLQIKSVLLLHSLSHGTYDDETPPPENLRRACEEAITVVEYFAPGQLELIKNAKQ